ncbi:MAG: NAD(P)H-binding protein [Burkholderiaceae bacterium]|nr:NAD(P)H-binding protein [Burkholderiaceae bacterium]
MAGPAASAGPGWRVAVAGASGLIGRALVAALAADARVAVVHALLRRPLTDAAWAAAPAGRIQPLIADPLRLGQPDGPALPALDLAFCALGTTIKTAGSQAAFRAVDLDAVLAFAGAARAAGARRFGLVSALGADARSAVFYNRTKGQAEQGLRAMHWPRLVIARPSLLLGDRQALGQPTRRGEWLAQRLMPALGGLLPGKLRPIRAETVARALQHTLLDEDSHPPLRVLESDALQRLGA